MGRSGKVEYHLCRMTQIISKESVIFLFTSFDSLVWDKIRFMRSFRPEGSRSRLHTHCEHTGIHSCVLYLKLTFCLQAINGSKMTALKAIIYTYIWFSFHSSNFQEANVGGADGLRTTWTNRKLRRLFYWGAGLSHLLPQTSPQ